MKIFGTVQPFVESPESSYKIGRLVANYEFFNALFKFSDFNEYHIFCPTYSNCKLTQERIFRDDISQNRKDRIKIFHISSLKKSIQNTEYDVFHLGGWGYFYPGFVHIRNIYSKKLFPITGITHSLNSKEAPYHAVKVCKAPIMPFDSIVCTSNCGKKVLQNLLSAADDFFHQSKLKYNGRMDVIPLGIDDKYNRLPDRKESRKLLKIDEDSFTILTLGRLEADNKMDMIPFLNTVKTFIKKNKDKKINLIIAGGCNNNGTKLFIDNLLVENQIQANTKLFLNFEDNLKPHLYRAANIYASPIDNFQETFGISVIEAMAHQCAVVVSDFDGYSEIVDQNVNGIKIPTFWADITKEFHGVSEIMTFQTWQLLLSQSVSVDQEKMLEAFQQLLDNPEKCDEMGQRARVKVVQKYFWSNVIRQYCCLWDELAKDAQQYTGEIPKDENPFELDYWKIFSHYPSNIVSEKNSISLTEYGREVMLSGKIPNAYSDVSASVIIPQLVAAAIHSIDKDTVTAQQFTGILKNNAEISDSTAMYYILWMAKYNLIKISE
ncbi:MAG: glycosyltransferase family 4 protein [Phycisphaerales bacterium]